MHIIVDCNYVCHVAKHSMGDFSFEDKKVGVIFGFLRQIVSLANTWETNQFIFCWDSVKSQRKKILPSYKEQRRTNKTEEEKEIDAIAYHQFDLLRIEILPMIGFLNNFMIDGYESDDLIAHFTKKYAEKEFLIVSSDNDLLQLLNRNRVRLYNIKTKKIYTEKLMKEELGITPSMWADVKSIAGCVSDNIPGVKGVGEKTAIKYLTSGLKVLSEKEKAISSFADFERNRSLIALPFRGVPDLRLFIQPKTSYDGMYSVCEKYGFVSLLNKENIQKWKKGFLAE